MSLFLVILLSCFTMAMVSCAYIRYVLIPDLEKDIKNKYSNQLNELKIKNNYLEEKAIDPTKVVSMKEHDRVVEELDFKRKLLVDENEELAVKLSKELERNDKLISQRQSNHVKLGMIVEKLYPLLPNFPYDATQCLPVYTPIDLIYFGDDDIVFIEIKSGGASLSGKQRKIKRLVSEGKVRFETHTISSKGINVR